MTEALRTLPATRFWWRQVCLLTLSFLCSDLLIGADAQVCLTLITPARSRTDGSFRICVLDVDVNRAYARAQTKVTVPAGNIQESPPVIGAIGDLFQATTEQRLVGLSPVVAAITFPFIDITRTNLASRCPSLYRGQGLACSTSSKFRRIDGYCTQPTANSYFGAAGRTVRREVPSRYGDWLSKPRVSRVDDSELPLARVVSNTIHPAISRNELSLNTMFVIFGQLVDHEVVDSLVLPPSPSGGWGGTGGFECCEREEHRTCLALRIPTNDPFYSRFGRTCMNFQRALPGIQNNCALGRREQFNSLTPVIDASSVYGSDIRKANALRDLTTKGRMATFSPFPASLNLKPLLPLKTVDPSVGCVRSRANLFCFRAGDDRNTEHPLLAANHLLWVRAHNDIAQKLESLNPRWDGNRIYEETRRIIGAMMQHIILKEWLPLLLPPSTLDFYGLRPSQQLFRTTGYQPNLDPQVSQGFITAAFRFAHSLLPDNLIIASNSHIPIGAFQLRTLLNRPDENYGPGRVDQFLLGGLNQPTNSFDQFITDEVRNFLFQEPNVAFGQDLAARNIQRGREHGVPGYTAFRTLCGLSPINSWADMALVVPNTTAAAFSRIYKSVDDVDLWSAGISENRSPSTILGPTFACIIGRQFNRLVYGDRFWYENPGFASSFTAAQLTEIKKITFARLLCDHSDAIRTVQMKAFLLPDPARNPRVACGSGILPRMDLTPWRE